MRKAVFLLVAILVFTLLASCCPKIKPVVQPPPPPPPPVVEQPPAPPPPEVKEEKPVVKEIVLEPIYFDFNKFDLRPGDREILNRNIQKLKENPQAKIRIEANCDERGTVEYNLALGEKRANATKDYLIKLGVDADRLTILSYGKEKAKSCQNDQCWSKDRRADFVLVSQ